MSDLISRDELINNLIPLLKEHIKNPYIQGLIIGNIANQPTTYDVEKVVAEITDRMDHERDSQIRARKAGNIDASNIHKYGRCCLALAIDIVKRGGYK